MADSRALDSSKLGKLLDDMETSFGSLTDSDGRVGGALRAVTLIRERLDRGDLDREDWPPIKRTPVDKVTVPVTNKVRKRDRGTSWEAAWAQTPEKSQQLYQLIYKLLERNGPSTDEELHFLLLTLNFSHSESGLRTRRSELTAAGWVQATNHRRPTKNGSPSTVWKLVPEETE